MEWSFHRLYESLHRGFLQSLDVDFTDAIFALQRRQHVFLVTTATPRHLYGGG